MSLKRRQRRKNLFTVAFLEDQLADDPLEDLFQKTKAHYQADRIFAEDERLNLKPATGLEIVRLLERYNLSDTSEDIKGIAFERFPWQDLPGRNRPVLHAAPHRRVHGAHGGAAGRRRHLRPGERFRRLPDPLLRDRAGADSCRRGPMRYQAFRRDLDGATHLSRGRQGRGAPQQV